MLKEKRASTDAECEERQKTRQLEMDACSKAFAVLNSDEAHGLLAKTFNFAVVQESEVPEHRTAAANVLPSVAIQNKSPRLATITNAYDGSIISESLNSSHYFQSMPFVLPKSELAFPHKSELAFSAQIGGSRPEWPRLPWSLGLQRSCHDLCDEMWDKYLNQRS